MVVARCLTVVIACLMVSAGGRAAEPTAATSLMPQLLAAGSGQIDPARTFVITGRERHVDMARDGNLPYPMRPARRPTHRRGRPPHGPRHAVRTPAVHRRGTAAAAAKTVGAAPAEAGGFAF
jgi:hypothetical protein